MSSNYLEFKKQAGAGGSLADAFSAFFQGAGTIGAVASSYIIAASVLGGLGTGYIGAKLTAHSKRDEDTVQKSYESKRLANDIGYEKAMLAQEWNMAKRRQNPTNAGSIRLS